MAEIPRGWIRQADGSFSPPGAARQSVTPGDGVDLEIPLHNKILEYCDSQWPRWKYIHANPSTKSTIGVGVHDITIFMTGNFDKQPRVLCVECKTRTGKLSVEQLAWDYEMQLVGFKVHVIRSFEEFLKLL